MNRSTFGRVPLSADNDYVALSSHPLAGLIKNFSGKVGLARSSVSTGAYAEHRGS